MNIDKPTGPLFVQSYQKLSQVPKVNQGKRVQNEDQLQISYQAKQMYEMKKEVNEARQEKINQLKAQIQEGIYQVPSEQVANKVFEFWFQK